MSTSRILSLLLALLLPSLANAREGPDSPIYVTAATADNDGPLYPCTALRVPYGCCSGVNTGNCETVVNGADICVALEAAEDAADDGKIERVILPEGTIIESEFRIYGTPYWGTGADRPCGGNFGDEGGFPDGLIIQGRGRDNTILKADTDNESYDGARTSTQDQALVGFSLNADGLSEEEMPRLIFQNFTLDGEREFQPTSIGAQYGFYGHGQNSQVNTEEPWPYLLIKGVRVGDTTRHPMDMSAINAQDRVNVQQGQMLVIQSVWPGGGCHQAHNEGTGSAGVLPCGCSRSDAGTTCAGWAWEDSVSHVGVHTPICPGSPAGCIGAGNPAACCTGAGTGPQCAWDLSVCPGWVNQGSSAGINIAYNAWIVSNLFDNGLHYSWGNGNQVGIPPDGINCAAESPAAQDDFSPNACGWGQHLAKNRFSHMGNIDNHGAYYTRLTDNLFDGTCIDDNFGIGECGNLTLAGSWFRWLYIARNYFQSPSSRGVEINGWQPQPGEIMTGDQDWPTSVVIDNIFELDCRRIVGASAQSAEPLTFDANKNETLIGTYLGDQGSFLIEGNLFQNTDANNDCIASINAAPFDRRPIQAARGWTRNLILRHNTLAAGGIDASTDGARFPGPTDGGGSPSANRPVANFNYVPGLHFENDESCVANGRALIPGLGEIDAACCTGANAGTCENVINGTGTDGKVSFAEDETTGNCYSTPTLNAGASVLNRASITTPCP